MMLDALCITGNGFLISVQAAIQIPDLGKHAVILGFLIEVFEIILQGLLLVLTTIFRQSFVGIAELWVKFDDFSKESDGLLAINTIEFEPITAITWIIKFAVIETCSFP
jgi:hypothetical protein